MHVKSKMMKMSVFRRFATSATRFCETAATEASQAVKTDERTRKQKIVDYIKNIVDDYKTVFIEIGQDMKASPVKSTVYISTLAGFGVLLKTNPGENEFHSKLTDYASDLMMVGEMIRNPHSNEVVSKFKNLDADKRLRCYNIGVCSLMCEKRYNPELGLYKARSKYMNPHWKDFFSTVVDVGVLGRWINLEKAMKNYDIHPEEWLENGEPNKNHKYYGFNPVSWDMKIK